MRGRVTVAVDGKCRRATERGGDDGKRPATIE
jgi:hypothetical protein